MMLSGPSAARDAKDHEGLLIMVKGRSKPIRPTIEIDSVILDQCVNGYAALQVPGKTALSIKKVSRNEGKKRPKI